MDNKRLYEYVRSSFLAPLLDDEGISDITYNGKDLYYLHREYGRQKSPIECSQVMAYDFLRHIANLCEVQWSVRDPYLDVSVGPLRINGVFTSIGRINYQKSPTFAVRIAPQRLITYEEDENMPPLLLVLLKVFLHFEHSLVIAGATSAGKTELQKYLLSLLPNFTRVIVIDNLQELECVRSDTIDLTLWQIGSSEQYNYASLIKNALRANPDWLVVAEARGGEMLDALNCAMSGHPLIMTLHSLDINAVSSRMTRMVLSGDKNLDYNIVYQDIILHFPIIIFMKKTTKSSGEVARIISEVGIYLENEFHLLYCLKEQPTYYSFPQPLKNQIAAIDENFLRAWEQQC